MTNWRRLLFPDRETLSKIKSLLTGERYPLHRFEPYRPFFIVGSGRSGSTLLRRILQAGPQVGAEIAEIGAETDKAIHHAIVATGRRSG